jgi:hypothetical protein
MPEKQLWLNILRETVELNAPGRPRVEAYRLRDLAVHLTGERHWTITHLPSGLNFGWYWTQAATATRVMIKMYDMTPSWGQLTPDDIERAGPAIYRLFVESGGRPLNMVPREMAEKGSFNGYH